VPFLLTIEYLRFTCPNFRARVPSQWPLHWSPSVCRDITPTSDHPPSPIWKPVGFPRVSADLSSGSRHTPAKAQGPSKGGRQRSVSNVTPRSAPYNSDVRGTNSTREFWVPGPAFLAKSVNDTLHPTVRLVQKPLSDLQVIDSPSSKWSASTGSIYSDYDTFSLLDSFPSPPSDTANAVRSEDWENSNSLSIPPVFMSCSNTSSDSVATVLATTTPALEPDKHSSCSFRQAQDSLVILRGRLHPKAPVKGDTSTSSNLARRTRLAEEILFFRLLRFDQPA